MHDTWNPWHGCKKISEGCANCYMYFLDQIRAQDGALIRLTNNMKKPLAKNRKGEYKIKSGELIRVCMTSDFFLEEADTWRTKAWDIMRIRSDVKFFLLTKRPERILSCLPSDWKDGWENIMINVTAENQKRADERIPILLDLPFIKESYVLHSYQKSTLNNTYPTKSNKSSSVEKTITAVDLAITSGLKVSINKPPNTILHLHLLKQAQPL